MKVLFAILAIAASSSAFAQANRATAPAPTPRSQPRGPVGPGSANNPAVISPPPALGQTFDRPFPGAPDASQRGLIGGPPASATPIDSAASVPRTAPSPAPVTPLGILGTNPVLVTNIGVGTIPPISTNASGLQSRFPGQPPRVANTVGTNFIRPLVGVLPTNEVVFNFPPGATIITNSGAAMQPQPIAPVGNAVGSPGAVQVGRGSVFRPVPPVTGGNPSSRVRSLRGVTNAAPPVLPLP